MFPLIAMLALGAVSAVSTIQQSQAASKAAKAQREANELNKQKMLAEQANERRKQIQEARIRQAQALQAGVNQGAADSSAVIGAVGSVGSQMSANLGYLNTQQKIATDTTAALNRVSSAEQQAGLWGGIGSLASTGAGMAYTSWANQATPTTPVTLPVKK